MEGGFDINGEYAITVADLAYLIGVTERRIQQLERDGHILKLEHGQYDLVESVRGYTEFTRHADKGSAASQEEQKERVKLTRAKRRTAELNLAEQAGNLARVDILKQHLFNLAAILNNNLMTMPDRIESILAAETDPDKCREILLVQVRESLDNILRDLENFKVKSSAVDVDLPVERNASIAG